MNLEIVDSFKNKYLELCGEYMHACQAFPTTAPKDIPEAMLILDRIKRFECLVKEFYSLEWDNISFGFKEVKRELGFFEE